MTDQKFFKGGRTRASAIGSTPGRVQGPISGAQKLKKKSRISVRFSTLSC